MLFRIKFYKGKVQIGIVYNTVPNDGKEKFVFNCTLYINSIFLTSNVLSVNYISQAIRKDRGETFDVKC